MVITVICHHLKLFGNLSPKIQFNSLGNDFARLPVYWKACIAHLAGCDHHVLPADMKYGKLRLQLVIKKTCLQSGLDLKTSLRAKRAISPVILMIVDKISSYRNIALRVTRKIIHLIVD